MFYQRTVHQFQKMSVGHYPPLIPEVSDKMLKKISFLLSLDIGQEALHWHEQQV